MIRFSILTCTYNAGSVLQRTLDSILNQTWVQIEHIIVDGASKDNTMALVNAYRQRNTEEDTQHDIVVSSEPDRGLYDAMNKALKKATGDYVVFLNAGDVLPNEKTLEDISNDVNERSDGLLPAVLYGNTNIVDNDGNLLRPRRLSPPENLNWRSFRHGMLVCHQAFFAKRSLAIPYDMQYRFSADFDWCIRIMKKARTLHNTHLTLIDYLEEGMTTQNQKASLRERFRIMVKHYGLVSTVAHHTWFVLRMILKK